MKDFQRILEDCLARLTNGTATLDECLARYPKHAEELKLLLQTALLLNRGRSVVPSPTFHAYTRSAVVQYIRSHPRQPRNMIMPLFQRSALAFAMLMMALIVTGTAQAQSALPGDTFYPWKRTSEQVWRAISLDPVATDIMLSERRLNEWLAVSDDPALSNNAMNNYLAALTKLETVKDVQTLTLIMPALQSQQQTLNNVGLSNSDLDDYLVDVANSIPATVATNVPPTATNIPPTATNVPPTATNVPPTATDVPPTATDVPPTATDVPPTATDVPPTATDIPPTATKVSPTATKVPPTAVPTSIPPTAVPTSIPPTAVPTSIPPTAQPTLEEIP